MKFYNMDSQMKFARLSGDFNPLHVEEGYGRRTMFGSAVVHGIHLVMAGIEDFCRIFQKPFFITRLRAQFLFPVKVGSNINFDFELSDKNELTITVLNQEIKAAKIFLQYESIDHHMCIHGNNGWNTIPSSPDFNSIETTMGKTQLCLDKMFARRLFPNFFHWGSIFQMAALTASTRIVGMMCPGLSSIYSGLMLSFELPDSEGPGYELPQPTHLLYYKVERFKPKLKQVEISLKNDLFSGAVKSFIRPEPIVQPSLKELGTLPALSFVKNKNILIIGASRGIGEVLSKLLLKSGAHIRATFNKGSGEVAKLMVEFEKYGNKIEYRSMNCIQNNGIDKLRDWLKDFSVNQIFFCATPYIESTTRETFSIELYKRFCSFYLKAFYSIFSVVNSPQLEFVWYPSTVYVDPVPKNLLEYSRAKLSGERMCRYLSKKYPGIKWEYPRLHRMETDQTLTLLGGKPLPKPHEYLINYFTELEGDVPE